MRPKESPIDKFITGFDRALRTLSPEANHASRPLPSQADEADLNDAETRHAAGLMRVNHTGEVCAQALYQGQALTAKLESVRDDMEKAADEEVDHLAWCEQRLRELHSRPSALNPLWYGMSFGMGAAAGLISDRVSLGFVAATEDQVCRHLDSHMEKLPEQDQRSKDIVRQMHLDEAKHGKAALQAGGLDFPTPVKKAMTLAAGVMTALSYRV